MTRTELREKLYNYIMESEHRLEIFVDTEICSSEEAEEARVELDKLLSDMSTNDMKTIADNIDHESEFDSYYDIFYGSRKHTDEAEQIHKEIETLKEEVSILLDNIEQLQIKLKNLNN